MAAIVASVLIIASLGLLMGMFFPTGMQLVRTVGDAETPWYWALNGIFGVLCSALAVFFSIYFGVSTNFYIAALCYALILPWIYFIYNAGRNAAQGTGSRMKGFPPG